MADRLSAAKSNMPGEDAEVAVLPNYSVVKCEPVRLTAKVVKGFGRGSKDLGCPTANMDKKDLGTALDTLENGVYAGWAMVDGKGPFKTVASVGFNPQYTDVKEKVVEPHLIHNFDEDFYGATLRFLVCGYLRPQWKFVDETGGFNFPMLIEAIQNDVRLSDSALSGGAYQELATDSLFAKL
jgi:riboflavin kinase